MTRNRTQTAQQKAFKREGWFKTIEEQAKSGLTQAAYCRQHGIKRDLFSYYRRKYLKHQSTSQNGAPFQAIEVELPQKKAQVCLQLDRERCLNFPPDYPVHLLAQLIKQL